MNINLQSKRALYLTIIISFAFITSIIYAKDRGIKFSDPDKKTSDTLAAQTQTKKHQLKYALMSNHNDLNSLLLNISEKDFSLPAGILLNDGTTWRYKSEFDQAKLIGMASVVLTIDAIGYSRLKELWYDWPTTKFHSINFSDDFEKYKWMDKYGHFLHAYFASGLFSKGYRWAGMSGENSILYGSLSGWLWMLQIEIADGFFEQWGFSWGDLIANTVGAGFSALQQIYPETLGGIQPKISYHISDALKERKYNNGAKSIIDDYEGMTFWLGVNAYHYMPENIQKNYPEWLKPFGLAIGHSAKGIANSPQGGEREIFIGLDYDLRKLPLGDESSLIRFLKNELNIIRLPLPAVKITPHGVWYGLYF
ncbi:MAG: DUF2279 domain-containing protein [Ignavibacteria bacterium]|nr:DUF2279 domain-containing protein [Ignavibacteria bacterium]